MINMPDDGSRDYDDSGRGDPRMRVMNHGEWVTQ